VNSVVARLALYQLWSTRSRRLPSSMVPCTWAPADRGALVFLIRPSPTDLNQRTSGSAAIVFAAQAER